MVSSGFRYAHFELLEQQAENGTRRNLRMIAKQIKIKFFDCLPLYQARAKSTPFQERKT